jgi:hypothetical protein
MCPMLEHLVTLALAFSYFDLKLFSSGGAVVGLLEGGSRNQSEVYMKSPPTKFARTNFCIQYTRVASLMQRVGATQVLGSISKQPSHFVEGLLVLTVLIVAKNYCALVAILNTVEGIS